MNQRNILVGILAVAIVVAAVIIAQRPQTSETAAASPEEIEGIVKQYLMDNPEVLIASLNAYRSKEEAARQAMVDDTVKSFMASVGEKSHMPVLGNPDGDVTIVEFFDYRCGYCKRVHPTVQEVLAKDGNVRLVYAEFPILGDDSLFASRAATAVWLNWPDKYEAYHDMLMATRGQIDETTVFGGALELGMDVAALQMAMKEPEVDAAIRANHDLASSLEISGTPAFIIGDELVPGAIELSDFESLISMSRGG